MSHVHAGGYAITAAGASDPDYAITCQAGTLLVTPASLMITANSGSKMYGAVLPTLSASYNGFVNGDTAASLAKPPTLTTAAEVSSHVRTGGYGIIASGAIDPDYGIT